MDLTAYTDANLTALLNQVIAEQERRRTLATAGQAAKQLADRYAAAVGTTPQDGATVPTMGWGPGQHVTFTGVEWINQSGAWLTVGPAAYPQGWRMANPPAAVASWVTGVAYKVGDLASYEGTPYRCIQAHTSQAGWTPPAVPALWAIA